MTYLPRSSYVLKPWKNGVGMTEEIYIHPSEKADFLFRISMAALSSSGPFSVFPGIDRSLILLEGNPVILNERTVPLLTPVDFPGEENIFATIDGEGRDLNLMCLREKASGRIEVASDEAAIGGNCDYCLIFALDDSVIAGETTLQKYDSILLTGPSTVRGKGFLIISITLS